MTPEEHYDRLYKTEGGVKVTCKHVNECVSAGYERKFDCSDISCGMGTWVTWTEYLINKEHFIEVKR